MKTPDKEFSLGNKERTMTIDVAIAVAYEIAIFISKKLIHVLLFIKVVV